jgi:hypothetical protein
VDESCKNIRILNADSASGICKYQNWKKGKRMRNLASLVPESAFLKLTISLVDLLVVTLAVKVGGRQISNKA